MSDEPRRITSPADLAAIREKARADIDLRDGAKDLRITVHMGTCGIAAGAREVLMAIMDELADASADNVTIRQAACAGLCDQEPMITIADKSGATYRYGRLDKPAVRRIVQEHVLRGVSVQDLLMKP